MNFMLRYYIFYKLVILTNSKLAISLNASNDETREKIMPINRKWPIQDLMKSVSNYSK